MAGISALDDNDTLWQEEEEDYTIQSPEFRPLLRANWVNDLRVGSFGFLCVITSVYVYVCVCVCVF